MNDEAAPPKGVAVPKVPSVRDGYFALPEDKRAQLLIRVEKADPDFFRFVLKLAHITGHRAEAASSWLKGPMLKRVEQFLDGKHKDANIQQAVYLFFRKTNNPLFNKFFANIADRSLGNPKPTTQDSAIALAKVRELAADDPYLPLFESWVQEDCTFTDRPPLPADLQSDFDALDRELDILREAITDLRQIRSCDVPTNSAALERANATTKALDERFTTLVKASGDTTTPAEWSTREEFCQLWEKFCASAAGLERQRQQSVEAVAGICRLLAAATVRHRLPRKQAELTALAKEAATEIGRQVEAFIPLLQTSPPPSPSPQDGTAAPITAPCQHIPDAISQGWLHRAWSQTGPAAEELLKDLQPLFPKLAELLAAADWEDLFWPKVQAASEPTGVPLLTSKVDAPPSTLQPEPQAVNKPPVTSSVVTTVAETPAAPPPATPIVPSQTAPPSSTPQPATTLQTLTSTAGQKTAPPAPPPPEPALKAQTQPAADFVTAAPVTATPPRQPAPTPAPAPLPAAKVSHPAATPPSPPEESVPAPSPVVPPPPSSANSPQPLPISQPPESKDIIWKLAREGRWGLASHIVKCLADSSLPPAWAFEAAALGPRVSYEISSLSERLAELFLLSGDFNIDALPAPAQPAARLLLVGAALRPALLAPQTGATSVLKLASLSGALHLTALDSLVEAAAEFALHRQALQPHMLRSSHNRADWDQQLGRVRADIRAWIEKAPKSNFSFAPALRIWLGWTGTNGALTGLLDRTAHAGAQDVVELTKSWARWANAPNNQVQSAMKSLGQWKPIDGAHRDKLIARIGEAVDLANRMLALLSQNPQAKADFREENIQRQLDAIRHHLEPAAEEVRELASASFPADVQVAALLCDQTLKGIAGLFTSNLPLPGAEEPNPRWLVDAELLRDACFFLDPDGLAVPPTSAQKDTLFGLAQASPDWKAAWQNQVKREDHAATAALLEVFTWENPGGLDLPALSSQRDRELEVCRQLVEKEARETRRLLDDLVSLGLCRQKDYETWSNEVESVKLEASHAIRFASLHSRLAAICANIQEERQNEVSLVRQRLATSKSIPQEDCQRINALLNAGDIYTATDYLDLVAQGLRLPETTRPPSLFLAFFGEQGWLPNNERDLSGASLSDCCIAARDGEIWQGLDFSLLRPDQRQNVLSQLQLWETLQRQRSANDTTLSQLALALGLRPARVISRPKRAGTYVIQPAAVQGEKFEDRALALVPSFGSDARGSYTLHLVWGEPDMEELLTTCHRETGDTSAHIVVTFRVLSAKDRRELAEEGRKVERLFKGVVVDTALFAFACAQPTSRLATLLRCALPFSCAEPYTISAGDVPPEMFFGRGRELASLADPRGSCFVYGGRQLGKTALLCALQRRFHRPTEDRAAVYVDLKREIFAKGRPIDDLWTVLVARLKDAGVLSDKVGASAGPDALIRHIKEWLGRTPDHRLLLLLDEADAFLDEDGKNVEHHKAFPRCHRLKGLMDDTGRRFKVVFAGLHNVQRSTRVSNHPLAHFGEAICIGPMLEVSESREARALVTQPLEAAGFYFESPEAVSLILALTNYYPSLIQLFCHHLLLDLRANYFTRFPKRNTTPPCVITSQHVHAVYASKVRQAIQEKFRLTLDLDKRYELIAYLLAFCHGVQTAADGFEIRELRDQAAAYWPAGFNEIRTDDEFRSLLEEMVGLGILRQVAESARFALRNRNVNALLGDKEDIESKLDSARTWESPWKYDAANFRRLLSDKPTLVFSPLTAQQESEIKTTQNRVAVLYGSPASGLGVVRSAMESDGLFGKARTAVVPDCKGAQELSDRIARLERPPQTHNIMLVPPETPWNEVWVQAANDRISQFTSKDAFLTVLFLADPKRTIDVLAGLDGAAERGVRELTLRPWHDVAVRQWLQESNLRDDLSERKRIQEVTGNWPTLLARLDVSAGQSAFQRSCDDLDKTLAKPTELDKLRVEFGLPPHSPNCPLRIAVQLRRFTLDELCEYCNAVDAPARARIADCLAWAQRLAFLSTAADGLEFDPIVARVLSAASP